MIRSFHPLVICCCLAAFACTSPTDSIVRASFEDPDSHQVYTWTEASETVIWEIQGNRWKRISFHEGWIFPVDGKLVTVPMQKGLGVFRFQTSTARYPIRATAANGDLWWWSPESGWQDFGGDVLAVVESAGQVLGARKSGEVTKLDSSKTTIAKIRTFGDEYDLAWNEGLGQIAFFDPYVEVLIVVDPVRKVTTKTPVVFKPDEVRWMTAYHPGLKQFCVVSSQMRVYASDGKVFVMQDVGDFTSLHSSVVLHSSNKVLRFGGFGLKVSSDLVPFRP